MSKRLVLLFCALFVFAAAIPAFAAVQNIKVSGDILARYIYRNDFDLTKDVAGSSDIISLFNTVTRLRVDADLTDNVSTVVRLVNSRNWDMSNYYDDPFIDTNTEGMNINLDLAYVTLKEFLCSPLTLTIGRQELHFGNDMIIGDGVGMPWAVPMAAGFGTNQTTNYEIEPGMRGNDFTGVNGDLSLLKAFDAIRATLNYDPLVVDLVYAKLQANKVFNWNDDADLYGMNAAYKLSDKWSTLIEGYFWNKIINAPNIDEGDGFVGPAKDKADTVQTIGIRASTNPMKKVNLQQEFAFQFGKYAGEGEEARDRRAMAAQTMLYVTPGWKHDPMFGLIYSYFSGDADPFSGDANKRYHGWDPMFENQTAGHILNALLPQTNAHNFDLMAKFVPFEDVTLRADYVFQMLAKKLSDTGDVVLNDYLKNASDEDIDLAAGNGTVGHEIDLNLTYDYTEDVQFGLMAGWFFPGNFFEKTNDADKGSVGANEMIASCKVSF